MWTLHLDLVEFTSCCCLFLEMKNKIMKTALSFVPPFHSPVFCVKYLTPSCTNNNAFLTKKRIQWLLCQTISSINILSENCYSRKHHHFVLWASSLSWHKRISLSISYFIFNVLLKANIAKVEVMLLYFIQKWIISTD